MRKVRRICGKVLLLSLCMALLLLAGCGTSKKAAANNFNYDTEMTDENSMEITLVNLSGHPVQEFNVWWDERDEGFDLLHNLDRNLEPDESITVRIPRSDDWYCFSAIGPDENGSNYYYGRIYKFIPEGGIVVMIPDARYTSKVKIVYEAGTDLETMKETVLAEYQAACEAALEAEKAAEEEAKRLEEEERLEKEKWERLANLSQEEIDEAVKSLGYDSLADMRTKKHRNLTADADQREEQAAYYELYGYWYPNGDRNSLTYIAITDEEFMWYQFDPEQGDVERGKLRLAAVSGGIRQSTFTMSDGNKFTVVRSSTLQEQSAGTLTFEDCTREYSQDTEYYYSRK